MLNTLYFLLKLLFLYCKTNYQLLKKSQPFMKSGILTSLLMINPTGPYPETKESTTLLTIPHTGPYPETEKSTTLIILMLSSSQ